MPRTANLSQLPAHLPGMIVQLGARIRLARQARHLRLEDMADRTGLSRKTVEAVERGELSTSLGAYVAILGCMNLERELDLIADPGLDREGLALTYAINERRVRVVSKLDNDF